MVSFDTPAITGRSEPLTAIKDRWRADMARAFPSRFAEAITTTETRDFIHKQQKRKFRLGEEVEGISIVLQSRQQMVKYFTSLSDPEFSISAYVIGINIQDQSHHFDEPGIDGAQSVIGDGKPGRRIFLGEDLSLGQKIRLFDSWAAYQPLIGPQADPENILHHLSWMGTSNSNGINAIREQLKDMVEIEGRHDMVIRPEKKGLAGWMP